MPDGVTRGPGFYSSSLGGPSLMLQLLRVYEAEMPGSEQYLDMAVGFADAMLQHGTDRYGNEHSPLFASLLVIPANATVDNSTTESAPAHDVLASSTALNSTLPPYLPRIQLALPTSPLSPPSPNPSAPASAPAPSTSSIGPTNFPRMYDAALHGGGPRRMAYFGANVLHDQDLYVLLYRLTDLKGEGVH